jgi:hypothetical protein
LPKPRLEAALTTLGRCQKQEKANAQGKRRRSTEGAEGTNTGNKNPKGLACVGVRLTAQLGAGYFYSLLIAFSFAVGIAEHAAILIKGCQMVVNEEEFVSERLNFEFFV